MKTDKHLYVIELAVAGFSKKDIAVTVENGVLTVESDRESNAEVADRRLFTEAFRSGTLEVLFDC